MVCVGVGNGCMQGLQGTTPYYVRLLDYTRCLLVPGGKLHNMLFTLHDITWLNAMPVWVFEKKTFLIIFFTKVLLFIIQQNSKSISVQSADGLL